MIDDTYSHNLDIQASNKLNKFGIAIDELLIFSNKL